MSAETRESNFDQMNRHYGTPAKRGMEVEYDGHPARITSCTGSHLRLRFDPEVREPRAGGGTFSLSGCTFHPLFKIDYLDGIDYAARFEGREKAFVAALSARAEEGGSVNKKRLTVRVKPVDTGRKPLDPGLEIEYVPGGRPYLWVGSEEHGCYGTVEGRSMEALARRILGPTPREEPDTDG